MNPKFWADQLIRRRRPLTTSAPLRISINDISTVDEELFPVAGRFVTSKVVATEVDGTVVETEVDGTVVETEVDGTVVVDGASEVVVGASVVVVGSGSGVEIDVTNA